MKHLWATACGTLLLAAGGWAQSPVVAYALPAAVKPGATNEVTFFGDKLAGATRLWTSFPCAADIIHSSNNGSGRTTVQMMVPRGTERGIGAVRLATTNGVSSLLLLCIDDLPGMPQNGTNRSVASAQNIRPPIAIDGAVQELGFDYYKFAARRGQRLVIEAIAQRMGSRLDPVVRLLDGKGRELAYCDDEPGLGSDARFVWRCPASGEYVLEIRDMLYQGGQQYRYRLRVSETEFATRGGQPRRSETPVCAEKEPNDRAGSATPFKVPALLCGTFSRDFDRDLYQFDAAKGERLVFRAQTRSLGSPCEVFLQVQQADGAKAAEARVTAADEGTITNKFSETGTYRLLVEELNRRGGPGFNYRVAVEPLRPGFALNVDTEKADVAAGGILEIKVLCTRRDFDGPIHLSLDGIDFAVEEGLIPEKKTNSVLKVKAPALLVAGEMMHFRIVGKAQIGETTETATASTSAALRKLFPQTAYPPAELDGLIGLGIKAPPVNPAKGAE